MRERERENDAMLRRLSVENYALIDKLDLELTEGLNIVTGETGAGKSILLGALSLLLGSRGEGSILGEGDRNCVVEGVFEIEGYGLEEFFGENDLEYDPQTVIRRIVTPAGKSRAYVNDLPVQLAMLRELGRRLIDIHSQHQSLMLGSDDFRTRIVDGVAGHENLTERYKKEYGALKDAEKELARLQEEAAGSRRDEEYLRFQTEQLAAAALREGEQAELEAQLAELSHAGQIQEALARSAETLGEEETGVLSRLKAIEQEFRRIAQVYAPAPRIEERIHSSLLELRDLESELSSEADRIEADPERLARVESRLNLIYDLQQKHRVNSVEELIGLYNEYAARLAKITGSDEEIAGTERRIAALRENARKTAGQISAERRKAGTAIEGHLRKTLSELGMPSVSFTVEITPDGELTPSGTDTIRFLFSANRNMAPQPVEKVASGGEISRVMLGIKSFVASRSKLPTIIFDEIDTGVSGRIADAMGRIIAALGEHMQVVNITHLPQVASKGEAHFFVYKEEFAGGIRTRIRRLGADERITEIAKMLSGSTVTDAALAQARLLLKV